MLLGGLALAAPLFAVSTGSASGAASGGHSNVLEVNVMNEQLRGGEPELAIDPRNPQDLVLGHTAVGNNYTADTVQDGLKAVQAGLQVSTDGGKTWSRDNRPIPTKGFTDPPNTFLLAHGQAAAHGYTATKSGAGDPIEASGPDGSIYAGGVLANAAPPGPPPFNFTVAQGGIAVFRSTNGGKTFGPLHAVLTDQELAGMVSRGMSPAYGGFGVVPFDRPWMVVDQSNGDVYVSTTGHPERYVVESTNKGNTWSRVEALDCDEATPEDANHGVTCSAYPQSGDGNIAASHGVLAAAYTSSAAPGHTCPCAIFETSTDAGAHWNRHVAFDNLPKGSGLFVAADPAQKGRFALMVLPATVVSGGLPGLPATKDTPQEVEVVTTNNSGTSWSLPKVLGDESTPHITNRPWIAYGPTGVLAALWRNANPPYNPTSFLVSGYQSVFAAISRDNGKTFSAPVQLNSKPSPPADPAQLAEDDVSWVVVTTQYVYGAWGDWRPTSKNPVAPQASPPAGELNSWIARVPFSSFKGRS